MVPSPRLPLRLVFLAALAIGAALVLGLVVATLNSVLEFYQRLSDLPLWLRVPLIALGAALLVAVGWLIWRLARENARSMPLSTKSSGTPCSFQFSIRTQSSVDSSVNDSRRVW